MRLRLYATIYGIISWKNKAVVCAYTEIRLPDSRSKSCHIDHFKTQNLYPNLKFEYINLVVSCNSENYGAKYKDKQVKRKEDYENLINPVEESPLEHLEFTFTGEVETREGSLKGKETISYFNLREKSLIERRKRALEILNGMKEFSEDEAVKAIGEFESMIRQLYKEVLAE